MFFHFPKFFKLTICSSLVLYIMPLDKALKKGAGN